MIKNALLLFFICAAVLIFFLPSYSKMIELRERNLALEKKINELEKDNVLTGDERRRLTDDPAYFEQVARQKLGIIRDDEVIYKVLAPGQKKAQASAETAGLYKKMSADLADDLDPFRDGLADVDPVLTADKTPAAVSRKQPVPTAVKKKTVTKVSAGSTIKKTSN